MGVYDRDYYRQDEPSGIFAGRSMVWNLIIANAAMFIAVMLFSQPNDRPLIRWLALSSEFFERPWEVWRLITYGFLHSPTDIWHIVFNMLGLWMFGREMEEIYGRSEFTRIYLATIAFSGLVWVIVTRIAYGPEMPGAPAPYVIGASGAVTGVIVLNVLHFPRREVLLFGVLPMPAWAFAGLFLASDMFGAMRRDTPVAHVVHLAGAAFVFLYYRMGWNFGRLVPERLMRVLERRPNLRVHDPAEDTRDLSTRVDEILDKIHRQGEASLTKDERRTLEEASKRYQRRQR